MSLLNRMLSAVRSWFDPRIGSKPARRARVAMEQLDHRQLLAVNFTGNVAIDFPVTNQPGVVALFDDGSGPNMTNTRPVFGMEPPGPALSDQIKVSGFDVVGIRVTYDSTDDTLNIGLEQPLNQKPGLGGVAGPRPVIAGDADNNGNSGTVDPATLAISPGFRDFADLQGPEALGAFLSLDNSGYADIVAGFPSRNTGAVKLYQVAEANVNRNMPPTSPVLNFDVPLPENTGNVYLVNSPLNPNLEFNITNFSSLYQRLTGNPFTPDVTIGVGAFGVASNNIGISDEFFKSRPVNIRQATPPVVVPPVCPPVSPPIIINHFNRTIDTAHDTRVRVTVLGSSGFNTGQIDISTVRFGGAAPVASFSRQLPGDRFPDRTFIFRGIDIELPPGQTQATLTGSTFAGATFSTTTTVLNRTEANFGQARIDARDRRLGRSADAMAVALLADDAAPFTPSAAGQIDAVVAQAVAESEAKAAQAAFAPPTTVSIPARQSAKARGSKFAPSAVPAMTAGSTFRNSAHLRSKTPARSAAARSLAAQDAALDALASSNHAEMPLTAE